MFGGSGLSMFGGFGPNGVLASTPVITAVADGTTVTITIDGDDDVTNQLLYMALGDEDWTNGNQHVGDGDIEISDLERGTTYMFTAYSSTPDAVASLPAPAISIDIAMPDADNIFDVEDRGSAEALLSTNGTEILYHPGGGDDQRAIDAILQYEPIEGSPGGRGPVISIMTRNTADRGISSNEFDRGGDEITIETNIDDPTMRRRLVNMPVQSKGMITLEVK